MNNVPNDYSPEIVRHEYKKNIFGVVLIIVTGVALLGAVLFLRNKIVFQQEKTNIPKDSMEQRVEAVFTGDQSADVYASPDQVQSLFNQKPSLPTTIPGQGLLKDRVEKIYAQQ